MSERTCELVDFSCTRGDMLCEPTTGDACASYIERTVWDGDQLLYELRGLGGNTASSFELNSDVSTQPYTYGKVGYVHAGGIDAPLVLMDGRVPNYNWRGLPESSVWLSGVSADCAIPPAGGGSCTTIAWPANQGVYMKPGSGGTTTSGGTATWVGSLMANGVGSTGMAYRRNRFNDGATGQFAFDNQGILKNASLEVRERIINGRVRHLEHEIRTFQNQIDALRNANMA